MRKYTIGSMANNEEKKMENSTIAGSSMSGLPADFLVDVEAEAQRVVTDVLSPRSLSERKILIIGGAGYVGSVVTDHLLSSGYRVVCLDNLIYQHNQTVPPFLSNPRYQFINADLTVAGALDAALEGVTDCVLLAGLVGDPVTKKYTELAQKINDDGYDTILEALREKGLNKVIFVSTCSNYGLIEGDVLADENFELKPLSLYAKSKVRFETRLLGQRGDVDYTPTVLRFSTAFGMSPRMRFDLTISEFTRALALGEELLVYDAHTWRPYCHVRDFAMLIERVLCAPKDRVAFEVFNAGGDKNNYTKQMILDAILEQIPDGKVRYQEHGSDPRNYRVDFTKIRTALYFEPAYSVPDGIRELTAAMRQGLFHDISVPPSFHGNWYL